MTDIRMNSVIPLPAKGVESAPDSPMPYYLLAKEGMFLYKRNILGRGIVKSYNMPSFLPSLECAGSFLFEAPIIPAPICASIVSFFRRIYDKHKAEAEVILTMNTETKEWRVFIPTQQVSGAAVNSVYEPSHIAPGHLVVGTMHSHCDFSAFHSGTDTADADDMDGVHFTIGRLLDEKPQIVGMVSMNRGRFDFKIPELADFTDLEAAQAPEWWDRYVTPNFNLQSTHKPVGFQLFDKYKKPTTTVSRWENGGTSRRSWDDDDGGWQNGHYNGSVWNRGPYGIAVPQSQRQFLPPTVQAQVVDDTKKKDKKVDDDLDDLFKNLYWEDAFDQKFVNMIYESAVITDDDILEAYESKDPVDEFYWRRLFLKKLHKVVTTLEALGIEVEYAMKIHKEAKPPKDKKKKKGIHR